MKHKKAPEMRSLILGYSTYTGTKKGYCAEHGVAIHTFDYWRKKLGSPTVSSSKAQGKFISLEVPNQEPIQNLSEKLEIHYANGNRLLLPSSVSIGLLSNLLQLSC